MNATTRVLNRPEFAPEIVNELPEYLTVDEVAELLRVSPATVYRLAKNDATLPVLRLSGLMRFPRERLARWLRDREQGQGRPRRIASRRDQGVSSSQ